MRACSPALFLLLFCSGAVPVRAQGDNVSGADQVQVDQSLGQMTDRLITNPGSASRAPLRITVTGTPENGLDVRRAEEVDIPTSAGGLNVRYRPSGDARPPGEAPSPAGNMPAAASPNPIQNFSSWEFQLLLAAVLAVLGTGIWWGSYRHRAAGISAADAEGLRANYRIIRQIGNGGMGVVYEAVDRSLQRRVAIKRMREEFRENSALAEQFLKEARTVAGLHHPAIVDIHAIVEQMGQIYLVFEFIEGRTLETILTHKGRLPLAQVKGVLGPVCQALEFAHQRGVIHRDLKPANVMVTKEGFVKVMDFGIARRLADSTPLPNAPATRGFAATRTIAGTPFYMAPEAEYGILCPESDIFSLGVMAYELLSGRRPFEEPASADQKLRRGYPKLSRVLPGASGGLEALIDQALEPDSARRIHAAGEFWLRLSSAS